MSTRNLYYGDPKKIDLSKMRADAVRLSRGDQLNDPQSAVIHHHVHEKPCNYPDHPAVGKHEFFAAVIGEEK